MGQGLFYYQEKAHFITVLL